MRPWKSLQPSVEHAGTPRPHGRAGIPNAPVTGRLRAYSDSAAALWKDEGAQGLVEYSLILAFTALLCISATRFVGAKVNNSLYNAANNLS